MKQRHRSDRQPAKTGNYASTVAGTGRPASSSDYNQKTDQPPKEKKAVDKKRKKAGVFGCFEESQLPGNTGDVGIYDKHRTDQADQWKLPGNINIERIHNIFFSVTKEKKIIITLPA